MPLALLATLGNWMKKFNFQDRDIVSIKDFNKEEIDYIINVAKKMIPIAKGKKTSNLLAGKILTTMFFEPSTRTRLSFESAMCRLGGKVISVFGQEGTSVMKGETLADTIKMAESYADTIVLRHPQEGAARLATEFSSKPVINGGDGAGQHPTQTLLDLFTIKTAKGKIQDMEIVMVGDLKYGRTVHSLTHALALFGAKIHFIAPPLLQMPQEIINGLKELGNEPTTGDSLEEVISSADVIYVTRIQKERIPDEAEYKKVAGSYRVDLELLSNAKKDLKIMHPLPRITEIANEVDGTPHALYFKQAFNGVPVRMALLALVMGKIP